MYVFIFVDCKYLYVNCKYQYNLLFRKQYDFFIFSEF